MAKRRNRTGGVSFFAFQDVITSVVGIFVLITLIMILELAQTVAEAQAQPAYSIDPSLLTTIEMLEQDVVQLQDQYDQLNRSAERSATTNRFNRDEQLEQLQAEQQQVADRISRATSITDETQRSIAEAKRITEQLLEDSRAADTDRNELDDLLDKKADTERFAAVLEIDRPLIYRDTTESGRWLVLMRLEDGEIRISDSRDGSQATFGGRRSVDRLADWLAKRDLRERHILLIVKPSGASDFDAVRLALDDASAVYGFDVAAEDANFALRFEIEAKR